MTRRDVVVGVDIGGTNTTFGFVDKDGRISGAGSIKTAQYKSVDAFIIALNQNIAARGSEVIKNGDVVGYGIGAPMGNINKGTIEHPAGLPWKGIIPFKEIFSKDIGVPVILTNDANAAAAGEMIYGSAKGMTNFVVITLGTGLGSGFVVDGKLLYGESGFAGEIGHTTIRPGISNRECGCGKKGCLETYVSATGLKRTLLKIMADSLYQSKLRGYSFDELNSHIIYEAALDGDRIAIEAFRHTGEMLGFKLADVVAHTSPEAIFLLGGLSMAKEMLFQPAQRSMEENLLPVFKGRVKLLPSGLSGQNAAILGAASLIWSTLKSKQ